MPDSIKKLKGHRKIVALTAYDYPMAFFVSEAEVDVILVGDSLGMVVLGYENTHFVTLEDMIRHTQAVMRGHNNGLVVCDMPKGSYGTPDVAILSARQLMEETGVKAIKIEGAPEIARVLVDAGIEVMGHTGLKPQEAEKMGIRGKTEEEAKVILQEARALEAAGCFAVVLECVPTDLAKKITEELEIPTIGIGAGPDCDGQILVTYDLLGLTPGGGPKFAKKYANLGEDIKSAVRHFKEEVEQGVFPE